jgi:hypothetical protein
MSIIRSAHRRDRPWDDNRHDLDGNHAWADDGQMDLDNEHGGVTSGESNSGSGREVRHGPSNMHGGHEVRDEHQGLPNDVPHDDDNDSNGDEHQKANAHEPRDGADHDHTGLDDQQGEVTSGESNSGLGHEVRHGPSNMHEGREVGDEHQGLPNDAPHDDDNDSNEDENQEANAHEPRDGADHDHMGLVDDEHHSHQAVNVSGDDFSDGRGDNSHPTITLLSEAGNAADDGVGVLTSDPSDGHNDTPNRVITLGGINAFASDPSDGHNTPNRVITLGAALFDGVNAFNQNDGTNHTLADEGQLSFFAAPPNQGGVHGDGSDTFFWADTFKQDNGTNHASADEGQRSLFASPFDQGGDVHSDGNLPDMTPNDVSLATLMDHWLL